ncbi:12534_t:CDS:2, partial [Entrophospora sp. SA101]
KISFELPEDEGGESSTGANHHTTEAQKQPWHIGCGCIVSIDPKKKPTRWDVTKKDPTSTEYGILNENLLN